MSKKLAALLVPKTYHPVDGGPAEEPIFASKAEIAFLKAHTDGTSTPTKFGVPSFENTYGLSTPAEQRASYSAPASSVGAHTSAPGTNGGGSSTTRGNAPSSSGNIGSNGGYDVGGGVNPASYDNGATAGYSRGNAQSTAPASSHVSATPNNGFVSDATASHVAQATRDAAWNHVMGSNPAATSDRMTVDMVPSIPTPINSPLKIASYSDSPSIMAANYGQYRQAPGAPAAADVTNRDHLNGSTGPDGADPAAFGDKTTAGYENPDVRFTDPRAGYFDQNGVTPQTQFADRLRESLQLQGLKPNDTAVSAMMGNFMNENGPAYMKMGSNPWSIDSPAAKGDFSVIGTNPDGKYTAGGIPQWNSGRLVGANSFFSDNGLDPHDPNNQAAAIAAEISGRLPGQTGDYKDTYNSMAGMSVPDATQTFMRNYENPSYNPAVNRIAARQATAQQFANNIPASLSPTQIAGQSDPAPSPLVAALMAGLTSPKKQPAAFNSLYGGQPVPKAAPQQVADTSYFGDLRGPVTLAGFATPAVATPDPFSVAQNDAAQPDGAGFAPNGNINPINPNGFVGHLAPIHTAVANYLGNRPYDPRTAATMAAMIAQATSGSHGTSFVKNRPDTTKTPVTAPTTSPIVQALMNPSYSLATGRGNYVVDATGNYWTIDPTTGRYVPVIPQGEAA